MASLGMATRPIQPLDVNMLRQLERDLAAHSADPREAAQCIRQLRSFLEGQARFEKARAPKTKSKPSSSSQRGRPASAARATDSDELTPAPSSRVVNSPVHVVAEAAPLVTAAPTVTWAFDPLDVTTSSHGAPLSLDAVTRAIWACELAGATQFDELLCLATLLGVVPHEYQMETVRKVMRSFRGRALLADEVGLGKTVEALIVLREYQMRRLVRRALVLAPPSLVGHWQRELEGKAQIRTRTTLSKDVAVDPERFWGDDGVVVASHSLARSEPHAARVAATPWDLVIVDEAHHIKNRNTASYKVVNSLATRFLLLLTATPIETDLEEIYNLVTLLRPGQFATPAQFRRQFVNTADPTSPKDRHQLRSLLSEVMVRNTRAGSGLALPPRFVTTVAVDSSAEEQQSYQLVTCLLRDFAADRGARLVASTLLLQAGSSPAALLGTLETVTASNKHSEAFRAACTQLLGLVRSQRLTQKTNALLEILTGHRQQALVFTRYRKTLEFLSAQFERTQLRHVTFHGGLSSAQKQTALDDFQAGAPVLLATDIGGEGQNLQFCSLMVNFDLPWNPMQIEQRIGRLHRMGQNSEVRVFNLCARGTAEERVLDVLDRRLHLFELVVGEMDMVLGNLTDERDLEERVLELYATSSTDQELDCGFDFIAAEIQRARTAYERTRAFDAALFQDDYAY